jgi:formylglycine-generating enzyme required for sulfatase activity
MRAMVVVAAGALAATASAGERAGRVIRVERAPSLEVFVPAGTFTMGVSDKDLKDAVDDCSRAYVEDVSDSFARTFITPSSDQTDVCTRYEQELEAMTERQVTLAAFAIDRDEVSVAGYRACVAAGACELDALIDGDERYLRDDGPMVNVTWLEARDFCHWRGGRLPTEAEWERAARGDDGRRWPWGFTDRPADFNHGQQRVPLMEQIERGISALDLVGDPDASDGAAELAPPGSYPWGAGPYGTRDQAGNVAEWTADVRGTSGDTLGYTGESLINPFRDGQDTDPRVVRGGSWRQPAFLGRANLRDPIGLITFQGARRLFQPQERFSYIGFRCARSL